MLQSLVEHHGSIDTYSIRAAYRHKSALRPISQIGIMVQCHCEYIAHAICRLRLATSQSLIWYPPCLPLPRICLQYTPRAKQLLKLQEPRLTTCRYHTANAPLCTHKLAIIQEDDLHVANNMHIDTRVVTFLSASTEGVFQWILVHSQSAWQ